MLFRLIFLLYNSITALKANVLMPLPDPSAPAFQESVQWAKQQAKKIRKKISTVERKQSKPLLSEEGFCRRQRGQLSCDKQSLRKPAPSQNPSSQSSLGQEQKLIFISLSMPKASLKSLFEEAQQGQATLVLRGLIHNSFRETLDVLKDLGISVQIDPTLFKHHAIQTVPTFVWIDHKGQEKAKLQGNVTLAFANQKLREVP